MLDLILGYLPWILSVIGSAAIIVYVLVFARKNSGGSNKIQTRLLQQILMVLQTQRNPTSSRSVNLITAKKNPVDLVPEEVQYGPTLEVEVRRVVLRRNVEKWGIESVLRKLQNLQRLKEKSGLEADKQAFQAYKEDVSWLQFEYNIGG